MKDLFSNVRFYIVSFSILLSVAILIRDSTEYQSSLFYIEITQHYALIAFFFLYVTLLASPVARLFTFIPYRGMYLKARRALGVSVFYFGLLHALFALFGELGGISAITKLSGKYSIALILAGIALLIFTLMAATANDKMVEILSFPKWKALHRLIYIASIFILIHAALIGSHFAEEGVNAILYAAVTFLFILEGIRFGKYLKSR